ncbi:hypothetical protein [Sphingobacterium paludis]|uniref:Uncharacterized protein n=1 Tax=Sphingobacterium paludis TaxID=1476465 RepID=A0A4R7DBW6_9SPHI|nr:hypothetical protein [Sphingobacterium paludis]TDS17675.1 hypothetical protein B0I21_101546 [Sphingobacterium paludis]
MENNGNNKPKTQQERGVAENEKENYTSVSSDKQSKADTEDKKDIKETDKKKESERSGGDLAGNAAGNSD